MIIFYFILGAFLRRWYGGLFDENKYHILGNRFLQTIIMICTFISIFLKDFYSLQNWIIAIIISLWLQFQFWSRGHGACFDIGRNEDPNESTIKRYNERWYHYICDFLFKKHKYGFLYDFVYMGLRYVCPMIGLYIMLYYFNLLKLNYIDNSISYIKLGLYVSPVYAFCWTVYEKEIWFRPKFEGINKPTKWAEIIVGGIIYSGCYFINH